MDRRRWLQYERSERPTNQHLPGAASRRPNESAEREIPFLSNKENGENRRWPATLYGVDPTVVSPGAIWWRDSRGYCLDCLMNSTRLKRRADQSSSIATWRTLSNPA